MLGVFKNNNGSSHSKEAIRFSGYDDSISKLFVAMRQATNFTQLEIADRIGADIKLIHLLESGAVAHLDDWAEVERVVRSYAAFIDISPVPALERLHYFIGTVCQKRIPPLRIEISRPEPVKRPVAPSRDESGRQPQMGGALGQERQATRRAVPPSAIVNDPVQVPVGQYGADKYGAIGSQQRQAPAMPLSNSLSRRIAGIHAQERTPLQGKPLASQGQQAHQPLAGGQNAAPVNRQQTPLAQHQQISQTAAKLAAQHKRGEVRHQRGSQHPRGNGQRYPAGYETPQQGRSTIEQFSSTPRSHPRRSDHLANNQSPLPKPMAARPPLTPTKKAQKIQEIGKMADRLSFHLSEQSASYDEANEAINLSKHDLSRSSSFGANTRHRDGLPLRRSQKPFGFVGLLAGALLIVSGMVYYSDHLPEGARITNILRETLGMTKRSDLSKRKKTKPAILRADVKRPISNKMTVDSSGAITFTNADLIK